MTNNIDENMIRRALRCGKGSVFNVYAAEDNLLSRYCW